MNDYSEGCHPEILRALSDSNMQQHLPYGGDEICNRAKQSVNAQLSPVNADIYFVTSGTLANLVIAASILKPHEAVIAADCGHIVTFETGAIEATGHKVIVTSAENGKLTAAAIQSVMNDHIHFPHTVRPRVAYISNTTELGTVYSPSELKDISNVCEANDLLLWLDGARLGAAIVADDDLSLSDVAELTDVFWIGGTKAGGLAGEAIVISNPALAADFAFAIKQRGAMLSKGRFLGCQFETLFKDGLLFRCARRAHELAQDFSRSIVNAGFQLFVETESNQIFAILPDSLVTQLLERFDFYVWRELDDGNSIVRLVASWATDEEQIEAFVAILNDAQASRSNS